MSNNYTNYTDQELINMHKNHGNALVRALVERLVVATKKSRIEKSNAEVLAKIRTINHHKKSS